MKTNRFWIIIGICSFSIVIGFLIGSSNSPVIGAAFSGLFGIIIALVGLMETKENEKRKFIIDHKKLSVAGKVLFAFSVFFITGVISGDNYRNNNISYFR